MANQKKCIIWGTALKSMPLFSSSSIGYYEYDSPRAGGKYLVPQSVHDSIDILFGVTPEDKIRLSGHIAKQNLIGNPPPIMEDENWLEKLPPISNPSERAYLLLEGLVKKYPRLIGQTFFYDIFFSDIKDNFNDPLNKSDQTFAKGPNPYTFFYALSYCSEEKELNYLLEHLIDLKFIELKRTPDKETVFRVTLKGFEKVNELSKSSNNSKTAFIAMWFHDTMKDLEESIRVSVNKSGYSPFIIKNKEHLNKIDDEILNGINISKLMVCDLTSETGKPRGSVYFEAGYAMGKDKPVVWTCDKKLEKEIPFDIRQYNCLFWEKEKMEDFVKKLQHRIENTVGKGPLKEVKDD